MSYERDKISFMIGKKIKALRLKKKMSQEQLALNSGLHPAYLGRVERGEKCASVETIFKLSKGLGVSASSIIDFENTTSDSKHEAINRIEYLFSDISDNTASEIVDIIEKIVKLKNQEE